MVRIKVEKFPLSKVQEWDDFVRNSPYGTIFATTSWLRSIEEAFERKCILYLAVHSGRIIAGIPVLHKKQGIFSVSTIPPISMYNGLLLSDSNSAPGYPAEHKTSISMLLSSVEKDCQYAALALHYLSDLSQYFSNRNWAITAQQNIIVNIADYTKAWLEFSQSLRRKIRRAEETELIFRPASDMDEILSLHQQSYANHALSPPISLEILRGWIHYLQNEELLQGFVANLPGDRAIAMRIVIPDGTVIYDWLAGSRISNPPIAASHWLVAKIMEHFSVIGYENFDFMGANTPGVKDFKKSFGGETVTYYLAMHYKYPFIRALVNIKDSYIRRKRKSG